jgi:superfamily II DNA helicase RecQ
MPKRSKKAKNVPSLRKSHRKRAPPTASYSLDQANTLQKQQGLLVQWREARLAGPDGITQEEALVTKLFRTIFYQDARPIQVKAIHHILFERKDCILTARTGLGKSRPLQAVSIMLPNTITLIIIPLDKIGREQAAKLERVNQNIAQLDPKSAKRGHSRTTSTPSTRLVRPLFLNSSTSDQDPRVWDKIRELEYTHILLSPEQAISKGMLEILLNPGFQERVAMVAVDEAHLVRRWGEEFRVSYAQLTTLRLRLGQSEFAHPWIACTATLDPDSFQKLRIGCAFQPDVKRLRASVDRPEIAYCFMPLTPKSFTKFTDLAFVIQPAKGKGNGIQALQHIPKTVIFIDSRSKIRTVAKLIRRWLQLRHLQVTIRELNQTVRWYHSTVGEKEQDNIYSSFAQPSSFIRIVVATESLGMGVDLDDIEVVVQYGFPINQDLETVMQRFGRAARGPSRSGKAILLYEKTRVLKAQQMLPPSQLEETDDPLVAEDDLRPVASGSRGDEDYPAPTNVVESIESEVQVDARAQSQTLVAKDNLTQKSKKQGKEVQAILVDIIRAVNSSRCARQLILAEYEEDQAEFECVPRPAKELCCNGCNHQLFRLETPPEEPNPLQHDPLRNSHPWERACFSFLTDWSKQKAAIAFQTIGWHPDADAFLSQWHLKYLCSRLNTWKSVEQLRDVLAANTADHPAYTWDWLDQYGQELIDQKPLAVAFAQSQVGVRNKNIRAARDARARSKTTSRSRSASEGRLPSIPPLLQGEQLSQEFLRRRTGSASSEEHRSHTPLQDDSQATGNLENTPKTPFCDSGFGSSFSSSFGALDGIATLVESPYISRQPAQRSSLYDNSVFGAWPLSSSAPQLSMSQPLPSSPMHKPLSEVQPNQQSLERTKTQQIGKKRPSVEPRRSLKRHQM